MTSQIEKKSQGFKGGTMIVYPREELEESLHIISATIGRCERIDQCNKYFKVIDNG